MHAQEDVAEVNLRDQIAVLSRRKWIVAVTAALVVGAALAASFAQSKAYRATAEVLLQPRVAEEIFSLDGETRVANDASRVETEIEVMRSRSVEDAVTTELGFEPEVVISAKGDTKVVRISAVHREPEEAARVANTFAAVYIETRRATLIDDLLAAGDQVQAKINEIDTQLSELEGPEAASDATARRTALQNQRAAYEQQLGQLELSGNLTQTGGAQLVSSAEAPSSPFRPTPLRNAVLALVVGLILGVGLAFLRDYLDDSVRSKADLESASGGLTVLGLIPAVAGWKDRREAHVTSLEKPNSPVAESYRSLRTSIQFAGLDRPITLLQFTSPSASEGKTTTLSNLAVALGRAGEQVIVVDCDLRRPRAHEFFACDNTVGFTSVLLGDVELDAALQPVEGQPRLRMLASGPPPPNPSELLSSPRAQKLFEALRAEADVVLIDSPPLLPVTDGLILAGVADAVVLVTTSNATSRRAVHRAVELLNQVNAPLIGAVLNAVRGGVDGYGYGYGYGYSSPYHAGQEASPRRPFRRQKQQADEALPATRS